MNLDDYIQEVEKISDDAVVSRLSRHLASWKNDDTNVVALDNSIESFFGKSWIKDYDTHSHLYKLWSGFKSEAILGIAGLTMNERLYLFGLFERVDSAESESGQKTVYAKLSAHT